MCVYGHWRTASPLFYPFSPHMWKSETTSVAWTRPDFPSHSPLAGHCCRYRWKFKYLRRAPPPPLFSLIKDNCGQLKVDFIQTHNLMFCIWYKTSSIIYSVTCLHSFSCIYNWSLQLKLRGSSYSARLWRGVVTSLWTARASAHTPACLSRLSFVQQQSLAMLTQAPSLP